MKIVVLDGYALNPGDLSWEALGELGDLSVYDRTSQEILIERATGADILIPNKVILGAKEMGALPDLKYIGVTATGVNIIDLEAARERGIVVTNIPSYSTASVAQHTFALILELVRSVGFHAERVRQGAWSQCPDFCFWDTTQVELNGKTLGIVGFGDIGQSVARIAQAFEMTVLVHTRSPDPNQQSWVRFVDLDTLLRCSDIISLHCPLTPETTGFINSEQIAIMKPGAFLINTARGQLIDEEALLVALTHQRLAGAGLDVLSQEPPPPDHPLLKAPNCVITPHLAWATLAARQRLMKILVDNIRSFMMGAPQNRVA